MKKEIVKKSGTFLEESLVELINKTVSSIETGISFLSEQLPDVISQLLKWKFYDSLLTFFIWILFLVLLFIGSGLIRKIVKKEYIKKEISENDLEITIALSWTLQVGSIIGFFITIALCRTWLQILIAPKLYLIEYAAEFLK